MSNTVSAKKRLRAKPEASVWHQPVLGEEVAALLRPAAGRIFLDGTLGGGGHSAALLAAGARVVGIDRDEQARARAAEVLAPYGDRLRIVAGNFADAPQLPEVLAAAPFDGALLDLGVSSHQLDCGERGFSFLHDGPLDMRMDPSSGAAAEALVNTADEAELAAIFRQFGEEPQARRVARAIVAERQRHPFTRTGQLAAFIEKLLGRRGRLHPATRVFQALRIAVNDELGSLRRALQGIPPLLRAGARLVVITFHSLEDRLVKTVFREGSRRWLDRPEWPAPRPNPGWIFRDLTRKSIVATAAEAAHNPRARSARLRAVEILPSGGEVMA